jgi:hypothetical protein
MNHIKSNMFIIINQLKAPILFSKVITNAHIYNVLL